MNQSGYFIRGYRAVSMAMHLFCAVALVVLLFPWLSEKRRTQVQRRWHSGLMRILNIEVRLNGVVPGLSEQNMMLVANHVSWLDIYLLSSVRPARFVSKLEVRSWPIIGWLAYQTGTLFIDRTKRHDTARINDEVATALQRGGCIAVFPEGTTTNGSLLLPFHASLLQPAVHSQSKVWPAVIRYVYADGSLNTAPAYIGELSFIDSLVLILSQSVIYAELEFLPPISAQGKARRELAKEVEQAIVAALKMGGNNEVDFSTDTATLSAT